MNSFKSTKMPMLRSSAKICYRTVCCWFKL